MEMVNANGYYYVDFLVNTNRNTAVMTQWLTGIGFHHA